MNRLKSAGFTLIELLVVISVIVVIAGLVIVSLSSSRAKSRDAKRIANLDTIRSGLEMYKLSRGELPATSPSSSSLCPISSEGSDSCTVNSILFDWTGLTDALQDYVSVMPKDPLNGKTGAFGVYAYYYQATASDYKIYAQLEEFSDSDDGGICTGFYELYSVGAQGWSCE